jgi:hypothetical protein
VAVANIFSGLVNWLGSLDQRLANLDEDMADGISAVELRRKPYSQATGQR